LKNVTNKFIHLTNDAIQKKSENYGKFEPGNKLSYNEFQKHFDQNASDLGIDMENNIIPQMKKIA
jgi:tubulin polyglutamylase TTLL1/tubulin monoglycylase TTLL3/8